MRRRTKLTADERGKIAAWLREQDAILYGSRTPYAGLPPLCALATGIQVGAAAIRRIIWRMRIGGEPLMYQGACQQAFCLQPRAA